MSIAALKQRIQSVLERPFFRKTLWVMGTRLVGLVMQLGYFVLVARALSVEEYGLFVGVAALAALVISFASFGSGDILVKNVSRHRELFRLYWGDALLKTVIFSGLLIGLCWFAAQSFFASQASTPAILLILCSDILFLTLWNVSGDALSSVDLLYRVGNLDLFYGFSKFMAAIALILCFDQPNLEIWAGLYCLSSIVTALLCLWVVTRSMGWPQFTGRWSWADLKEGIFFSLSYSAEKINGDIDKTMLASTASLQAAGLYAAGSRFLTAAYVPVHSLFSSSYMRFFKHGASGISGSLKFAQKLLPSVLGYGLLTTAGFLLCAPLLPLLLGEDYRDSVAVLQWLSPYVLLLGVQTIAANTLTGAGFQPLRSGVNVGAALLNIGLNLWLIPLYSWKGAAWATLASDGVKLVLLWSMVGVLYRASQNADPKVPSEV